MLINEYIFILQILAILTHAEMTVGVIGLEVAYSNVNVQKVIMDYNALIVRIILQEIS